MICTKIIKSTSLLPDLSSATLNFDALLFSGLPLLFEFFSSLLDTLLLSRRSFCFLVFAKPEGRGRAKIIALNEFAKQDTIAAFKCHPNRDNDRKYLTSKSVLEPDCRWHTSAQGVDLP